MVSSLPELPHEDSDSEPSYDQLSTRDNVANTFLNYYHSIQWQFLVTMTNVILLVIDSYHLCFNQNYRSIFMIKLLIYALDIIVVVDIIFITSRRGFKIAYKRTLYESSSLIAIILECITLYTVVADIFEFDGLLLMPKYSCLIYRNYRIFLYYKFIFNHGNNQRIVFFTKYIPIYVLYIHAWVCVWHMGCMNCTFADHPENSYLHHRDMRTVARDIKWQLREGRRKSLKEEPFERYIFSMFFIMGSITRLGFGDPSQKNTYEQLVSSLIMVTAMILIVIFASDLAANKRQMYSNRMDFSNRLQLISKFLSDPRFSKKIRNKTINYYISYWEKQNALDSGQLLSYLPVALRSDIMLDEYWFAINQMSIFQREEVYVKRLVASLMVTEYFNKDAVILNQGGNSHDVFFIARGSVFILSEEDGESPLLSLGVGTTFGDLCLFYSHRCRFSVVAQTYCILHVLKKRDLWRMQNFVCLDVSHKLNKSLQNRIKDIKLNRSRYKYSENEGIKALVRMKNILITDVELSIYDDRKKFKPFKHHYDSYVMSNVQSKRIYDGLFFQTTWPWKLYDNSSFIFLWECLVVVVVLIMLFIWPIKIYLESDYDNYTLMMYKWHFWVFFTLDVVIQVFTVVETPSGVHYKLDDIFNQRWTDIVFIYDVIAALPFDIAVGGSNDNQDLRWYYIASMSLKLCKVKRIPMFIKKLENRYLFVQMRNFRLLSYMFFLLAISYVCGCFYYLIICFDNAGCYVGRWSQVKEKPSWQKLLYVFHFSLSLMTQTSISRIETQRELIWSMAFALLGLYLYYYFIADYAASYILADQRWNNFLCDVDDLHLFMQSHLVDKVTMRRVHRYLWAQWQYDNCTRSKELFYDTPDDFYHAQQIAYFLDICKEQPIFQSISDQLLRAIAEKCEMVFIPQGEIVVYGGVIIDNVYIIDKGFCEIISSVTGKTKKILGPKEDVNCIEAVLRKPSSHDIKAITAVTLVKIHVIDIKYAFALEPSIYKILNELVNFTLTSLKDDMRMFTCRHVLNYKYELKHVDKSWFVFPRKSKDPLYLDLKKNFSNDNLFWLLQYILMHRTLYPSGKFLITWEIIRTIVVWLMCMISPAEIFYWHTIPYLWYSSLVLNIFLVADMYIQMHVCYYNSIGVLVTHPNYTAQRYMESRMIMDAIGALPMNLLINYVFSDGSPKTPKYQAILSLNRYILLYRSRCLIKQSKLTIKNNILNTILYFCFILIAMYNGLASILIVMTCRFEYSEKNHLILTPYPNSTLQRFDTTPQKKLMHYYFLGLRWVSTKFLNIGYERSDVHTISGELYYNIIIYFSGYFFFGYIIVYIVSKFAISIHMSRHHIDVASLKKFMKKENISKSTMKYTIEHYRYVWSRTKGASNAISKISSPPIRHDFALALYGPTIEMAIPFHNTDISFKRRLGYHLVEEIFNDRAIIIDNNDIVDHMYLIHKGVVNVVGPAGDVMDSMGIGSIFGNFDNVKMVRSMVGIVAWGKVDVLKLPTAKLYGVLEDDPHVVQKIQDYQTLNYISYIKRKPIPRKEVDYIKSPLLLRLRSVLFNKYFIIIDMILIITCYNCVSYYFVFRGEIVKFVIFLCDVWVVFKIILDLMNPGYHRYTDIKVMVKKNTLSLRFFVDVFSVVPFQFIIPPIYKQHSFFLHRALHANKMIRLYYLYYYFRIIDLSRHKSIVAIKLCSVLCFTVVLIHTGACIFYFIACPSGKPKGESWLYHNNIEYCSMPYICAMNYAISSLFGRGHYHLKPRSQLDCLITITYATVFRFHIGIVVGYAFAIAAHNKEELTEHTNIASNLQNSLRRSNISPILLARVWNYTHHMWMKNRGKQIPRLIETAPRHIMSLIKMEAFGDHIMNSAVFENCHRDFLRQLVLVLDVQNYFCGDIICHLGDINDLIYFIHRGNVEVVKDEKSEDLVVDDLEEGDCFGLIQGLFPCQKHQFAYKARNVVEIVTLEYNKWSYLLPFFPASRFNIYDKLESLMQYKTTQHGPLIIRPSANRRTRIYTKPTMI